MKNKLPKYVQKVTGSNKYQVIIRSKKYDKKKYIGIFESINDAVLARDKFVIENYNDFSEGYLPRGITNFKGRFNASFTFMGNDLFIGSFRDLSEAIEARNNYIDSLK